jgi:excisionase family DNA binding protein
MRTQEHQSSEWLSPTDLGQWLGLGRTKTYTLLREEIPSYRIGRRTLRVRREDIDAWLRTNRHSQQN